MIPICRRQTLYASASILNSKAAGYGRSWKRPWKAASESQAPYGTRQIGEHEQVRRTLESGKVFLNESGKLISQGLQSGTEKMMENEKIASVVNKAGEKLDSIREDERVQEGMDKLRDTVGKTAERIQRFFNKKR